MPRLPTTNTQIANVMTLFQKEDAPDNEQGVADQTDTQVHPRELTQNSADPSTVAGGH